MGGLAFKDKTRRILRAEVEPTIRWLSKITNIDYDYLSKNLLGSGGLAETSGDLDINMCQDTFNEKDKFADLLVDKLGTDNVKKRLYVNQIFTCVPIKGDSNNGFVQVDFMFGNAKWQHFSYFSPGEKSAYKGLFRTELIKAAVAFQSDWTLWEDGELVARVGPTFFHDRGIVWRYRHRAPRKDGNGRVQTFTQLTMEEFCKLYPKAPKVSRENIDSQIGTSMLIFNTVEQTGAFFSYETLSRALSNHYNTTDFGIIMTMFEERLNSLKVDIPEDIKNEILTATEPAY